MSIIRFLSLILTISFGLISFKSYGQDEIKLVKLHLSKIVFHSSRCNGLCPKLDLEIDSNKNIFVNREFYLSKSKIDNKNSGNFKGFVNEQDYEKLIIILGNSNLDSLEFPNIICCDGIITTIIIYYEGKRKYLKSMTPPHSSDQLIWILNKIGYDKSFKKAYETKSIED